MKPPLPRLRVEKLGLRIEPVIAALLAAVMLRAALPRNSMKPPILGSGFFRFISLTNCVGTSGIPSNFRASRPSTFAASGADISCDGFWTL